MRRLLLAAVVAGLLLSTAPVALGAQPQRDTWDDSYSLAPDAFCGFAVNVHDYGWDAYNKVSEDGWTWAKTWQGTREYTNPENSLTASMTWAWRTAQTLVDQGLDTVSLQIVSSGSIRVSGPAGVVKFNAGQLAYTVEETWNGSGWDVSGGYPPDWWHGPHPMDLTNAFCDTMTELLNP